MSDGLGERPAMRYEESTNVDAQRRRKEEAEGDEEQDNNNNNKALKIMEAVAREEDTDRN